MTIYSIPIGSTYKIQFHNKAEKLQYLKEESSVLWYFMSNYWYAKNSKSRKASLDTLRQKQIDFAHSQGYNKESKSKSGPTILSKTLYKV